MDLSVAAVCRELGINEHRLRTWERRYNAVNPQRTASGRRVYTQDQLARLRLLKGLADLGDSIGRIAGLGDQELASRLAAKLRSVSSASQANGGEAEGLAAERAALVGLLNEYRLQEVSRQLSEAANRMNAREFVLHFAAPLVRQIGFEVIEGKLTMAHEHAFSALLHARLSALKERLQTQRGTFDSRGVHFVATTLEGDWHELGLKMGGVLIAAHGFRLTYFGVNLPSQTIAEASQAVNATHVLVAISGAASHSGPNGMFERLAELGGHLHNVAELWVGGPATRDAADKIQDMSATHLSTFELLDEKLAFLAGGLGKGDAN